MYYADSKDVFFINGDNGKALRKIQNTLGSLLSRVGKVVGINKLNLTHVRKSAEVTIQKNDAMKRKCNILNSHTDRVGQKFYDPTNSSARVEYIQHMEWKESPQKKPKKRKEMFDLDRDERKKRMEEEDAKERKRAAEEYLKTVKEKSKRNMTTGKRCRVKHEHKIFLLQLISAELFQSEVQVFPKGNSRKNFIKKLFYIQLFRR